nr:ORF3 [Torque teno felis virus]
MGWSLRQTGPANLVPQKILPRDPETKPISGQMTSTPMGYSQKELITELLDIIKEISDADFDLSSGLNISLTSSETSSQTSDSSLSDDFEMLEPPSFPPEGGMGPPTTPSTSKFVYCPFNKELN